MGLGVLDDRVMEHVPGTTRYFDDPERPQIASNDTTSLKCDRSGPVPIILVPQPSDDPNDPLNWPLWKRDGILFVLSLVSIFATALGPILAANTFSLSYQFGLPFTQIALLTGYYLLGVGVAGILFVASARIWGKRHLFLLGAILLVLSSAWAGAGGLNYTNFLWARIFQGIGTAPFEALVNATVGDLYFVHQRGKRMALTNLAVFGGAFFTPIVVGKISDSIGWEWSFYFVAIFCGLCLPVIIFFVPETAYRRSAHLNTDMASSEDIHLYKRESGEQAILGDDERIPSRREKQNAGTLEPPADSIGLVEKQGDHQDNRMNTNGLSASTPRTSYLQSLKPFNGRKTDESFWKLLIRPFPLFVHPAILWGCLIQGTMIGWTVFIGIILSALFIGPPLFWTEANTGYTYSGAFIGAVLGFLVAGALADWSAKFMTRLNNGIYEPEFRIILVIPQLVFGCTGLYGFGIICADLSKYNWIWPVVFFGLEVMGMVIGAVASALYLVDAHREIAIEAFTCLMMFKNFFSFALTFCAYDWVKQTNGTYRTFMGIASVQVVICLLSIPMYIYGKRNRSFFHRHDILKLTHLQ